MRTLWVAVLVAVLAGGCGGSERPPEDATLTVYVSVPLSGPRGAAGTQIAAGANRALAAADGEAGGVQVRARIIDETAGQGGPAAVASSARQATEDSAAIAYIGELDSAGTFTSLPITNEARMLQISPAAGAVELVAPFDGSDEVPARTQPTGARTFGTLAGLDGDDRDLGYEAMSLALDSIDRADDPLDRASVVAAFFATGEVDGPLGPYTINEVGEAEPAR